MVKNKIKSGILFLVIIPIFMVCVTGCITSYNLQTFSNDVETLPATITERVNQDGTVSLRIAVEGQFTGKDYETVMRMANQEGYDKVLSIEYGTRHLFGFLGFKWVTIRCVKEIDLP
jgi:hypothetical protein